MEVAGTDSRVLNATTNLRYTRFLAIDNPVLGNKETGNPALAYAAKGNATLSFAIICFKPL